MSVATKHQDHESTATKPTDGPLLIPALTQANRAKRSLAVFVIKRPNEKKAVDKLVLSSYTLNMQSTNETVLMHLDRLVNKLLFLKKKPFFQFQGVKFYPSEIHLLLVVREKTATNATAIAKELGVTKGAVSQTLSRLEKKGVLTKTKDPYHKNELTLTFTPFGSSVFRHYGTHAAKLLKMHQRYLDHFSDEEKAVVQRFLIEAQKVFDELS